MRKLLLLMSLIAVSTLEARNEKNKTKNDNKLETNNDISKDYSNDVNALQKKNQNEERNITTTTDRNVNNGIAEIDETVQYIERKVEDLEGAVLDMAKNVKDAVINEFDYVDTHYDNKVNQTVVNQNTIDSSKNNMLADHHLDNDENTKVSRDMNNNEHVSIKRDDKKSIKINAEQSDFKKFVKNMWKNHKTAVIGGIVAGASIVAGVKVLIGIKKEKNNVNATPASSPEKISNTMSPIHVKNDLKYPFDLYNHHRESDMKKVINNTIELFEGDNSPYRSPANFFGSMYANVLKAHNLSVWSKIEKNVDQKMKREEYIKTLMSIRKEFTPEYKNTIIGLFNAVFASYNQGQDKWYSTYKVSLFAEDVNTEDEHMDLTTNAYAFVVPQIVLTNM